LGLASTTALARLGARVVMGVRDEAKGATAAEAVRAGVPGADLVVRRLDLADLASVRDFAARVRDEGDRVDVLMNNAGVMMPRRRRTTTDGFELQFGTNHLGHWALTALLLPTLSTSPGARVVTVSSIAARDAAIRWDDLSWRFGYRPAAAYGMSKLANLLFALELDRRLRAAGGGVLSIAAHPGVAATNLSATMGLPRPLITLSRYVLPGPEQAARPQLHAAAGGDVEGGAYYGPSGPGEVRGRRVRRLSLPAPATSLDAAARLWDVSAELTGLGMPV
jgi:NAD(P)-dependent dehydrogenase (short-subunit alcohol dehydrogenase family)